MIALLLSAALLPADTVYATPALREFVSRAAVENRLAPAELRRYGALVETEAALVLHTPEGEELATQVEQIASRMEWTADDDYHQRVVGHRFRALGPNVSVLTYLREGWLVPVLYGEDLGIFTPSDTTSDEPTLRALHPLGEERARYYRFEGGDTVAVLRLPERVLHVVRVAVIPTRGPGERAVLFHGTIDLDAERHQIVRMRGRLVRHHPDAGIGERVLRRTLRPLAFIELENAEHEGRFWLPRHQRIELQATVPVSASRAIIRIVSEFRELSVDGSSPDRSGRLTFAPRDSVGGFDAWRYAMGEATGGLGARDFDDVAPADLRSDGPPRLGLRVDRFSEAVRYNRVEGLYIGAGAALDFRDAAPGLSLRATGGWAWHAREPRGTAALTLRRAPWDISLSAGRALRHTNDFTMSFEHDGAFLPAALLAGIDDYDYLDRRSVTATVARHLRSGGESSLRFEFGWHEDRALERIVREAPLGGDTLRHNRPITPGRYALARATIEQRRSLLGFTLEPGFGARLAVEQAFGGLEWQRLETALLARHAIGPVTVTARLDAGAVIGDPPPLQTIFELASFTDLPGYGYKEFAGDRAALFRANLRYDPGLLDSPLRLGAVVLPGLSPAPVLRLHAGWTAASASAAEAIAALGSRPTPAPRHSLDLRLTFFGGAIGLGAARQLHTKDGWTFLWTVGTAL